MQQRDLAEAVSAPERPHDAPVDDDLRPSGLDDVEALAGIALPEHRGAGRERGVLEPDAELLDRRDRERTEHADAAQHLDVGVAHAHAPVEPAQRRPARRHGERREQPDPDERGTDAEQLHDQRRDQPAGRHPEREDRLEAGEHARQDGLVGEPREQRESADVDQCIADADQAEQNDRRRLLGSEADHRQRRPEQRDAEPEPGGEAAAADELERGDRPEQSAGADRGVEHADARVAGVQEIDGDHHREHREGAAGERLHDAERGDQRQAAVGRDGGEPPEHPGARGGPFVRGGAS